MYYSIINKKKLIDTGFARFSKDNRKLSYGRFQDIGCQRAHPGQSTCIKNIFRMMAIQEQYCLILTVRFLLQQSQVLQNILSNITWNSSGLPAWRQTKVLKTKERNSNTGIIQKNYFRFNISPIKFLKNQTNDCPTNPCCHRRRPQDLS